MSTFDTIEIIKITPEDRGYKVEYKNKGRDRIKYTRKLYDFLENCIGEVGMLVHPDSIIRNMAHFKISRKMKNKKN